MKNFKKNAILDLVQIQGGESDKPKTRQTISFDGFNDGVKGNACISTDLKMKSR